MTYLVVVVIILGLFGGGAVAAPADDTAGETSQPAARPGLRTARCRGPPANCRREEVCPDDEVPSPQCQLSRTATVPSPTTQVRFDPPTAPRCPDGSTEILEVTSQLCRVVTRDRGGELFDGPPGEFPEGSQASGEVSGNADRGRRGFGSVVP